MNERGLGAFAGALSVGVLFWLVRLTPWGWVAGGLVAVALGWVLGSYIKRLRYQAEHDGLTGLFNRRPFERELRRVLKSHVKSRRPISLLFFEVDDFGAVNKRYGHLAGDQALRAVCQEIRRTVRERDMLARWGGDEFVILLPGTTPGLALRLAERIRSRVEQLRVVERNLQVAITVSAGVASFPDTVERPEELLRLAIEAQQRAKRVKNMVEVVS